MNQRGFRDDAPPWSFFLPVTLAVVIGSLIADAIRLATGAVFDSDVAETAEPAKTPAEAPTMDAGVATREDASASSTEQSRADVMADIEPPGLPGPISAMRDGTASACIGGSVADRRPNGWEQALQDDAPVRCVAISP